MCGVSSFALDDQGDEEPAPDRGQGLEVLRGEIVKYDDLRWTHDGGHGSGRAGGAYTKFDDRKKEQYVNLIRQGIRRVKAAMYVGVSYAVVLNHMKRFPEFAQAVSEAEMVRIDEVESALFETAIAGNVTAQQIVLYNRRPEEWADQRMLRARIEAAAADAAASERREAEDAVGGLRSKLGELRERLASEEADEDGELPDLEDEDDLEPEPVRVVDDVDEG